MRLIVKLEYTHHQFQSAVRCPPKVECVRHRHFSGVSAAQAKVDFVRCPLSAKSGLYPSQVLFQCRCPAKKLNLSARGTFPVCPISIISTRLSATSQKIGLSVTALEQCLWRYFMNQFATWNLAGKIVRRPQVATTA
jgi:hypothetical protein